MRISKTSDNLISAPDYKVGLFIGGLFLLLGVFGMYGILVHFWEAIGIGFIIGILAVVSSIIRLFKGYWQFKPFLYSLTIIPFLGSCLGGVMAGIGGKLGYDVTYYSIYYLSKIVPYQAIWIAAYIAGTAVLLAYFLNRIDFYWNAGIQRVQSAFMLWYYVKTQGILQGKTEVKTPEVAEVITEAKPHLKL